MPQPDTQALIPVLVDFQTADAKFWSKFHAWRRLRQLEWRPDDPIAPDDIVEAQLKKGDPFSEDRNYFIFGEGGEIISGFGAGHIKEGAPGYDTNKHILWGGGSVHEDHRRRGIAKSWLPLAVELMDEFGATVFTTGTELESGHAFLKWAGFEGKAEFAENRLDLAAVDWDMVDRWIREGQEKSPGTTLTLYADRLPQEVWEEFAPKLTELLNTMPFDDMDHGEIVVTPEMMREDYERMDLAKGVHHTIVTREADGHISGMTDVRWFPHRDEFVGQRFTGVNPKDRGRAIGRWIKAAMLRHIREVHPQAKWMVTGNAESNGPMLAINRDLGFKQYKPSTTYQISRDRLAETAAKIN